MTESKKSTIKQAFERAVGRRKTAAARVRILPGKGKVTINDRELISYFPGTLDRMQVEGPLKVTGMLERLDVSVKVAGGGIHGQAEAVRHGISRALIKWDESLKPVLKAEGFLTRDSRMKERKKAGLRKARRSHQWRKR